MCCSSFSRYAFASSVMPGMMPPNYPVRSTSRDGTEERLLPRLARRPGRPPRGVIEPLPGELRDSRVPLDPEVASAEVQARDPYGTGARKRVEHDVIRVGEEPHELEQERERLLGRDEPRLGLPAVDRD